MTVIRWNPLREIDDLFARTGQVSRRASPNVGARFTPLADISETDAAYVVELELPGVAAEDVDVVVHEGVLSVAGERHAPHVSNDTKDAKDAQDGNDEEDSPKRRLHRVERQFGKFERRFRLPKDASADDVEASAKDGVLRVTIKRKEAAMRRAIEVKVA